MSFTQNLDSTARLLPNFLARSSVNFLLGPFASKKTSLALDLAIHVAAGQPWLGFGCQPAPALIVDYTCDLSALRHRIHALVSASGITERFPFYFYEDSSFGGPQKLLSVLPHALKTQAGLIVLDSPLGMRLELNACSAPSLLPYLVAFNHLANEANAAVLVLHDLRSHRTDLGKALVEMGVDHVLAAESAFNSPFVHVRTLSSDQGLRIAIKARVERRHNFTDISLSSAPPPSQLGRLGKRLLVHLGQLEQATTPQLISVFPQTSPKRIINLIQELLTDGYIYRANQGGRGVPANYRLAPAGVQVSTRCQESTTPAPASEVTTSHLDLGSGQAYNPVFHNPFALQRKLCSE